VADSLRDQLVKAGLATSAQAKKAERSGRAVETAKRHDKAKDKTKGKSEPTSQTQQVKAKAAQQRAEKAARDKAIAQVRNAKSEAKAKQAQVRQLIAQNDQRTKVSDDEAVPYNFVHGQKIKKIHVTKVQLEALSSGRLIVVNNNGIYHFVDEKVAEQIAARDPKRIIVAHGNENKDATPSADDEHYAKFAIPDDLDW
jgi:uncharacterized protein YaiL (DUF2058 family)|tara:strand:+ start:625 stop:1218 length:594 start_codon:yes stop_codon:yes gene_type:complete